MSPKIFISAIVKVYTPKAEAVIGGNSTKCPAGYSVEWADTYL